MQENYQPQQQYKSLFFYIEKLESLLSVSMLQILPHFLGVETVVTMTGIWGGNLTEQT